MKKSMYVLPMVLLALFGCKKDKVQLSAEEVGGATSKASANSTARLGAFVPSGYSLVWEDEFDGTSLNTNNWFVGCKEPVSGDRIPGALGDYLLVNDYSGYITPEDVYLDSGALVLRGQKRTYQGTSPAGTYQYTDGWVASMHKVHLNKGYIEIRAKMPSGDKVWPAFWLVSEDLVWGPEWDMWEYFGKKGSGSDLMGCHLMTGTYPNTQWYSYDINSFDATYDCETWHTYGFEWTDTYAKWYLDGNVVRTLNSSSVSQWPNEEMYLILNNGQRTSSSDATTTWPNYVKVDYIQIYQKPQTFNGNFETGSLAPWFNYGTTSISSTNQRSGNYCAYIGADNSGYEYTVSGLNPNTKYSFRGYVKAAVNGQVANISAKDYGGSQVVASTSNTAYTPLLSTFTTGATNTSAKICFFRWGNGTGQAWGDDFEIYASPVVPNGNFETGLVSPWSKYGTSSVSSTNQYAGSYCAYLGADNSGYEYVISGLRPNTSYTFRGFVKSAGSGQVANICAKDFGGNQVTANTTSTAYTQLSVTFTTGASNTSAKLCFFRWGNGSGQAYGDNFEIVENQ